MKKLEAEGRAPHLVMGDAVTVRGEKTADQLGDLPGIQTRLKELVPQTDEIR
jgi:hypothetical protein